MRILHVASWYPNKWDNIEGVFVKKHFEVFSEVFDGHLLNVQVRHGTQWFRYEHVKYSDREEGFYFLTKIRSTKVIEVLTAFLLLWALIISKHKRYDLLNFHVAYPLLSYYSIWKHFIKLPVVILEHWTAYHLNFNMPRNTNKLNRIKRIFQQSIPLMTVSDALREDIQIFSGSQDFTAITIPNVLNKKYQDKSRANSDTPVFFIVNIWRQLKSPFAMLEAFAHLASIGVTFELRIGGYGDLLEAMQCFVVANDLSDRILFLGKLDDKEIENELNLCDAYLFSSKYETFSVACADALMCGCPLIGPPIPCILEYTPPGDIIVVNEDTPGEWISSLQFFVDNQDSFDKTEISGRANRYFSNDKIREIYRRFVNEHFGVGEV